MVQFPPKQGYLGSSCDAARHYRAYGLVATQTICLGPGAGLGKFPAKHGSTPMADCLIVIPARLKATRLPGKPLADIAGEPMIVHVWRRAVEAGCGPVVVATDSEAVR